MFAVIRSGGKQYRVEKDSTIRVEKLDAEEGSNVDCEVLFAEGAKSAKVSATVVAHDRNDKVVIFKKKRRQNYRRKNGHKQHQTVLKIVDVKAG